MPKATLFIGSSAAAKSQAKAVVEKFKGPTIEFLLWWDAFTPGKILLEELDNIRDQVNGAILLFSPEAEATVSGQNGVDTQPERALRVRVLLWLLGKRKGGNAQVWGLLSAVRLRWLHPHPWKLFLQARCRYPSRETN